MTKNDYITYLCVLYICYLHFGMICVDKEPCVTRDDCNDGKNCENSFCRQGNLLLTMLSNIFEK